MGFTSKTLFENILLNVDKILFGKKIPANIL